MIIRKAKRTDAAAIFDLRDRAIREGCQGFYTDEQISLWTGGAVPDGFIDDIEKNFYVTELNGQIIGSGKLTLNTGMIDAIFVEPACMGCGAGTAMMAFLEELAMKGGLTRLRLTSTLNAAAFYRSCGYVGDEITIYHSPRGISLDCVPMEKKIEH